MKTKTHIPKKERVLIGKIVDRIRAKFPNVDKISTLMDLESAHLDIPLDLKKLLNSDEFNFMHDITGIDRHMDRTSFPGKLINCFVPRCSF